MTGRCHHTLVCFMGALSDVSQVVILKRAVIVIGSSRHFTAFKMTNFTDHFVFPSEWKGAPVSLFSSIMLFAPSIVHCYRFSQEHKDDVMSGCALPPHSVITGSYDGELVVWNTNSELVSRRMNQRCQERVDAVSHVCVTSVILVPLFLSHGPSTSVDVIIT